MAFRIVKEIKNGVEYFPPENSGGGGADTITVDALIDAKLGSFDGLFKLNSGLYKVLNDLTDEDELGLTEGETWADILANQNSMNKISHGYTVMVYIANSSYAMGLLVNSDIWAKEVSECWNSISIIANCELANDIYLSSDTAVKYLFTYQVAQDAFFTDTATRTAIINAHVTVIASDDTLLQNWYTDTTVSDAIANNTTALTTIASDITKLNIVKSSSTITTALFNNTTATNAISTNDFITLLEDATRLSKILAGTASKSKLASANVDTVVLPVVMSYTGLTGYSTFDALIADSTALSTVINNANAIAVISNNNWAIQAILTDTSISSSTFTTLFNNSTFATGATANNTNLWYIASNTNALSGLMSSTNWASVRDNYTKINALMSNATARDYIIAHDTSANLSGDAPLRAIIKNNGLDTYIAKDERASNGLIVFDINAISLTTFKIARYGYNAVTSTRKYCIDGWAWTSTSVAASTTALSINLPSTGNHTLVIKPDTYNVGWARQMGNRNSTNYWNNTPNTLKFSVRNLPGYAFMSWATTIPNYFMYYAFYGCTSLTSIKLDVNTTATSIGTYYMYYMFGACTSLTGIEGKILPSTVTTVGNYFMAYMFYGCTEILKLPNWFTLSTITSSLGSYFLYYFMYNCKKLTGLPFGMQLPPVNGTSYYLQYAFYGCTALWVSTPTETLTFKYAASYCFTSTSVTPASPSNGAVVAVHRV